MLADIVSKNGNLLLNLPLRADGTLDAREESIVEELAAWTAINGKAIFGTRPWRIYGERFEEADNRDFDKNTLEYTAQDIRFTTKGNLLYAIAWRGQNRGSYHPVASRYCCSGGTDASWRRSLGDSPYFARVAHHTASAETRGLCLCSSNRGRGLSIGRKLSDYPFELFLLDRGRDDLQEVGRSNILLALGNRPAIQRLKGPRRIVIVLHVLGDLCR